MTRSSFLRVVGFFSVLSLVGLSAAARTSSRDTAFQRELNARIEEMLRQRDLVPVGHAVDRPPRNTRRPWLMPVAGVSRQDLTDSFGAVRSGGRRHQGIDIFAPRRTAVLAVTNGVVTAIRHTPKGGRTLYLISTDGHTFYYAHLDGWAPSLFDGKRVHRGQVLGYVGNSGNAAGSRCHLHFEIEENGRTRNPYVLLRSQAGDIEPASVMTSAESTR